MTKKTLRAMVLSLLALLMLAPAGMAGAYELPVEGSPLAYAYVDGTLRFEDIFITAARVNMRSGPGLSYARVGKLGKGVLITRTQQQGLWVKIVTVNGTDAWVYSPYLAPVTNGNIKLVTTAVNVRKGPGTRYAIIGGLNPGALVLTVDKTGKWIKVCFEGGYGYIYADYLQVYAKPISSPAAASSSGGGGTPRNTPSSSPTPTPPLPPTPSPTPTPTAYLAALERAEAVWAFTFNPVADFSSYGKTYYADPALREESEKAGYQGVPYGQNAVANANYVLLHENGASLADFTAALADPNSALYTHPDWRDNNTSASYPNGHLSSYYNLDCSGYVSYIVGLPRYSTTGLNTAAGTGTGSIEKLYFGTYEELHVGDILNIPGVHTRWVYRIDESGDPDSIEDDIVRYYEQRATYKFTIKLNRTIAALRVEGYDVIHVKDFDYLEGIKVYP
ncbi:MAG: SH3 domain-containing protein [Christensenellaceae bacterium]|nr:SH3 domain-containing protein [Christensenellaceae bacterium]